METALILAGIQIVTELVSAKLARDQTSAEERAKLVQALLQSSMTATQAHLDFLKEAITPNGKP